MGEDIKKYLEVLINLDYRTMSEIVRKESGQKVMSELLRDKGSYYKQELIRAFANVIHKRYTKEVNEVVELLDTYESIIKEDNYGV